MSLLIIGGTGTLGRQIVLQALTKGYPVRCLVRNFRKANFLKEWGVELVYGDLTKPETIPPCLKGITAVIDASTSRASELESLKKVDWEGKLCLIEAAKVANIQRFIFFSAQNVEQFENIPLMKIKNGIEIKLKESGIPYTIFRLTGFYQGLIEQYAIPILENLPRCFVETISYGMIGYVVPLSIYPKGYHPNPKLPLPFAHLANQKNSINFYHNGIYTDKVLLKWFLENYPNYTDLKLNMGKSCIRFKKMDKIPYRLIGELMTKISVREWIHI